MEASTLQAPAALQRLSVPASLMRLRSDEQLVASFRGGSEEAFRVIHDRYCARLLAYSRQMLGGSRQDAEDVMQDVFVRVYRALRASDRPVALRAWLYRIAHNRCIDQLRGPKAEVADVFDMSRTPTADPATVVERREDLQQLVTDVSRLPDQQRSALLMRELQGLSYEELASSLDVTVAAVKSLLVRARGGLVDSAQARDATCDSVRQDLALACDRGVRSSGLSRRHLRDCGSCRQYRQELRGVQRRLGALVPVGPLGGLLWQVGGVGGGGAAAGGSVSAGVGATSAILTATKVALVCAAAAVTAGGALGLTPKSIENAFREPTAAHVRTRHLAAPISTRAANSSLPAAITALATTSRSRPLGASTTANLVTPTRLVHHRRHHASLQPALLVVAPVGGADLLPATPPVTNALTGGTSAPATATGATGPSGTTTPVLLNAPNDAASAPSTSSPDGAGGLTDTSDNLPTTGAVAPSSATGATTTPSSTVTPGTGSTSSAGSSSTPPPPPSASMPTTASSASTDASGSGYASGGPAGAGSVNPATPAGTPTSASPTPSA